MSRPTARRRRGGCRSERGLPVWPARRGRPCGVCDIPRARDAERGRAYALQGPLTVGLNPPLRDRAVETPAGGSVQGAGRYGRRPCTLASAVGCDAYVGVDALLVCWLPTWIRPLERP